MAEDFYDLIIKNLKQVGWILLRSAKGSHEIWQYPQTNKKVTVPRSTKSRHTANGILKSAGINKKV